MEKESGGGAASVPPPVTDSDPDEADSSLGDDEQLEPSEFEPYDYTDIADRFYACEIEEIPSFRWMTPSQRKIEPLQDVELDDEPARLPQRALEGGETLRIKMEQLVSSKWALEHRIRQYRFRSAKPELESWFQEVEKQRIKVEVLLTKKRGKVNLRDHTAKKLKELDQLHEQQANWSDDDMILEPLPSIPVHEIRKVTDNFGPKSLITPFSRTYYAVLRNGTPAAIRKLDPSIQSEQEFLKRISAISRLKHENVVELVGGCVDGNLRILAYEFATRGSLYDMLHGKYSFRGSQPHCVLSWSQRVKISVGVARGLEYLHERTHPAIFHGRIKSSNVLLFDDDVARIADFGFSNELSTMEMLLLYNDAEYNIIYPYKPPEDEVYLSDSGWYEPSFLLNSKSDIYSFGVILLELLTGRRPVDLTSEKKEFPLNEYKRMQWVDKKLKGDYPLKEVAKVAEVAALCLQRDAKSRPDMSLVVNALEPLSPKSKLLGLF